jgi:hypothetical protein
LSVQAEYLAAQKTLLELRRRRSTFKELSDAYYRFRIAERPVDVATNILAVPGITRGKADEGLKQMMLDKSKERTAT